MSMEPDDLRVLVSAGDVSGDAHGAELVRALRRRAVGSGRNLQICALGGAQIRSAGASLLADTSAVSSVGLVESLPLLPRAWALRRRASRGLRRWRPSVAVLIDYPGINIPLAERLTRAGVPVIYYIPPEEWLWSTRGNRLLDRTGRLARAVSRVLAVHPVEADFYASLGCDVDMVGHPLVDRVAAQRISADAARSRLGVATGTPVIALLPASRRQELRFVWPVLAEASARLLSRDPRRRFLLPVSTPRLAVPIRRAVEKAVRLFPALRGRIRVIEEGACELPASALAVAAADLALTKSGSATVEIALRGVPQVPVYRLGAGTIWIGRHILGLCEDDIANFVLVNHILQRPVVPELLLHRATPEAVADTAEALLAPDSRERESQLRGYDQLRNLLGGPGAAERAAAAIWEVLEAPVTMPVNRGP